MIFEKVRKILSEELFVDEDKITLESDMINDLNADSLDLVQLLVRMERDMGVFVEDEEIKAIKTVGDVVNTIERKLNK